MPERGLDHPPRLLVVGGTGLLGRALLALAPPGTTATHHRTAPGDGSRWHRVDLADGGRQAAAVVRELSPAAVVNAAAVTAGPNLAAITAVAPGALATACVDVGARFVHISSDVVFAGDRTSPYVEGDRPDPVHDYGRAKADAEAAVAEADAGAVIVRTSLLWSSSDCPQIRLVRDPRVTFFTDEIRCPLRVDRLAAACLELTGRPEIVGPLHVAGCDAVDRHTFARALAPLAGCDADSIRGGPGDPDAARPRHLHLDSGLARATLDAPLPGVGDDAGTVPR